MISTFMAENFLVTRIVLAVILVLTIVAAVVLARRPGRRVAIAVAIFSGVLLLAFTFSPDPRAVQSETMCNLAPRAFAFDALNIALFLVPAMFAVVALRRAVMVALAVPVVSALIELVQLFSPALGRRCDIDDWLANLVGGLIGVAFGALALRSARRRAA